MKIKIVLCVLLTLMIGVGALNLPQNPDYDYLRLNIMVDADLQNEDCINEIDTEVKNFLFAYLSETKTKQQAIDIVDNNVDLLIAICNTELKRFGLDFDVKIKIDKAYFDEKTFSNTTLSAGYYDAVIIMIGNPKDTKTTSIIYPPLFFENKNQTTSQIKFESRIKNWFNKIFG